MSSSILAGFPFRDPFSSHGLDSFAMSKLFYDSKPVCELSPRIEIIKPKLIHAEQVRHIYILSLNNQYGYWNHGRRKANLVPFTKFKSFPRNLSQIWNARFGKQPGMVNECSVLFDDQASYLSSSSFATGARCFLIFTASSIPSPLCSSPAMGSGF